MAAAGIAVVPSIVARQAEEDVARRHELECSPRGPDILVVIALACREILAEAGVAEARRGNADPQRLGEWRRC